MGTSPSFAASDTVHQYKSMTVEQLAYCELESAPVEVHADILSARDVIIHRTSWTVNGQVALCNEDGTIEELPEFSELFPGWDVPAAHNEEDVIMPYTVDYAGAVYLRHPTSAKTPPFYAASPSASGITIEMKAYSLPGRTWNGAFDNLTLNQQIGYVTDMTISKRIAVIDAKSYYSYAARASTYSTEGYAVMNVYEVQA